jgi:small subunit ribosomal protein S15
MSITKERTEQLIGEFKRGENDTGSAEVQIALLTSRISHLTEHLQTHRSDFAGRRGLLRMVSRRRRLLDYLKRVDPLRYLEILRRLELRK